MVDNQWVINLIKSKRKYYDKRAFDIIGYKPRFNGTYLVFNNGQYKNAANYSMQGRVMPLLNNVLHEYITIGDVKYLLSFGSDGNIETDRHFQFT